LQFGRNCKEGVFVRFSARNSYAEFVRPSNPKAIHRAHHFKSNSIPAPFSSLGALGGMLPRRAVGFVLLDAVSLL